MKKFIWTFLFVFILTAINPQKFVYAEDNSLDLDTAIGKAMNNTSALKNIENKLNNLQENYENYKNASLLAQSRYDADVHYRELLNNNNLNIKEKNELEYYTQNFGAPLTAEERIYYKKMKELTIPNIDYAMNISTLQKQVIKNTIISSVSELYGNLIKVNNGIALEKGLVEDLNKNYTTSMDKLQNGFISSSQTEIIKLNLDKENLQLSKLQRNKEYLINTLNKVMDEDINTRYTKYEDIKFNPIEHKTLNDYLTQALKSRIEILSTSQAYDLKQQEYSIIAEVYLDDNNLNKINAKYDLSSTKTKKDNAKTKVEQEIKVSYKLLQNKIADYENYIKKYDIQKSFYEDIQKKYFIGFATDLNLMDAELALKNAQLQMDNARIDVWLYQIKMKYAAEAGPAFSVEVNK